MPMTIFLSLMPSPCTADIILRSTCADHYLISSFATGRVHSPYFLVLSIIYLLPLCMFLLCTPCLCALSFLFLCFFVDAFLFSMMFLDIVFRFPFEACTLCFAMHSALTLLITVLCFRSCHSSFNS